LPQQARAFGTLQTVEAAGKQAVQRVSAADRPADREYFDGNQADYGPVAREKKLGV
jgi:hypothetical protein